MTQHALIFDLDGTLVDSLPGIANSLNRALAGMGLAGHSQQAVRGFIGNGARVLVARAAPHGTADGLLGQLEQAFKEDYDLTWPQGTAAYPGVAGVLAQLQHRGAALAVLSNKPHPFTTAMVSALFPAVAFAAVLGQRPGTPHKPNPAGAFEIAATLGLPPQACMVIGDSTMDLETARNAGMRAVAVTWGYHDLDTLLATRPDAVLDTPEALLVLLDKVPNEPYWPTRTFSPH
ncbi:MAG: HAD-IA family hydrolase [Verrucomicrobia bacterium]|nr:HAD-IA family hydrolase [Verrucomicrobiota bacterium]